MVTATTSSTASTTTATTTSAKTAAAKIVSTLGAGSGVDVTTLATSLVAAEKAPRQAEIDATRIQAFTQLEQTPYLSKRFLLKRCLDLSEEEMQDNEEMWNEENQSAEETTAPVRSVRVQETSLA